VVESMIYSVLYSEKRIQFTCGKDTDHSEEASLSFKNAVTELCKSCQAEILVVVLIVFSLAFRCKENELLEVPSGVYQGT
jgi:hypothetical protein